MSKKFLKSGLKDGMVVELRNGEKKFCVNRNLHGLHSHSTIGCYNDDLTSCIESKLDICTVYEIVEVCDLECMLEDGYGLKKIWKRKESTIIKDLNPGERFKYKVFEWIVLDNNVDGNVMAIMATAWNNKEYCFDDNRCNNYAKSSLRRKLLNELLPVLGKDNLIPHEVDLVADNGDDSYGTVTDRVFILSCDEYRKYRKNVPLLPEWMWTCTPWYIPNSRYDYGVRGVGAGGNLSNDYASNSSGVTPACVFKKDVVVEEVNKDD